MEEGLPKVPKLELAQFKFLLTREIGAKSPKAETLKIKENLLNEIIKDNMTPFYLDCCKELSWEVDEKLLGKMKLENETKLKELDGKIEDAEKNLGETEIRETNLAKAEYLSLIGDKESSLTQFRKTYEKTVTLGHKLDLVFHQIRIGFFFYDYDLIERNLDKAKTLLDEGGDWDRRNRLKVYQGLNALMKRDFKTASLQFLDTVATFTSYELMDYSQFVVYTIFATTVALPRGELRSKVTRGAEILEVLHGLPNIKNYLFSLYECRYADFFKSLGTLCK
jgi:26S proteasome regulatory subunit N7